MSNGHDKPATKTMDHLERLLPHMNANVDPL